MSLVGRRGEQDQLRRAVGRLRGGQPALVQVRGPAGIGKSRLLDLLVEQCVGITVLRGRAVEPEAAVPYAPLRAALGPLVRDPALRALGPDARDTLDRALDPLAAPPERHAAHAAVRAAFDALAVRGPVAVVLDDVHWADPATEELLLLLLARRWQTRMLLAIGLRPHAVSRRLARALDRFAAAGDEVLEPAPLTDTEAAELLGGSVTPAVLNAAGGNPFFLLELARNPAAVEANPDEGPVPRAVQAVLTDALESCSAAARRTALAAGVIGDLSDVALLSAAAELDAETIRAALDELVAADLMVASGARFGFRHPLIAAAVVHGAPPGWRAGAHARVDALLAERGAPATARAPHVERTAEPGDQAAVAVLAEAGRSIGRRTPAIAVRWLDAALALLPDGDVRGRLGLQLPLVSALASLGELDRSRTVLREVLAVLPAGSGTPRAEALRALAGLQQALGEWRAAEASLAEALGEAEPGTATEAIVQLRVVTGHLQRGDWNAMEAHAKAALAAARAAGAPALEAAALAKLALATYHVGDVAGALVAAGDAARLADELADDPLLGRGEALIWLSWAEQLLERPHAAIAHARRAVEMLSPQGQELLLVPVLAAQAEAELALGRVADGLATAQVAWDHASLLDREDPLLLAGATRAEALRLAGRSQDAVAVARRALDGVTDVGPGGSALLCRLRLGAALIAAGEPAAGRDAVLAASGGADLGLLEPTWRSTWYEQLTLAELALDDAAAAAGWAARAAAAGDHALAGRAAAAARAQAAVALAESDVARAVEAARRAVTHATGAADGAGADDVRRPPSTREKTYGVGRAPAPGADDVRRPPSTREETSVVGPLALEGARAGLLLGRALAAHGDASAAADALRAALAHVEGGGADRFENELRAALRRLGRPAKAQTKAGSGTLSAREREVALLAAEGRRNREIAAALFITENTVESHLRRAFGKLGVRSRTALAARLMADPEQVHGNPG